jgi:hypothetical protein
VKKRFQSLLFKWVNVYRYTSDGFFMKVGVDGALRHVVQLKSTKANSLTGVQYGGTVGAMVGLYNDKSQGYQGGGISSHYSQFNPPSLVWSYPQFKLNSVYP